MSATTAERIVNRIIDKVSTLKLQLPPVEYRKLTQKLADLEEHERCGEMAEAYGEQSARYEWDQPNFKPAF